MEETKSRSRRSESRSRGRGRGRARAGGQRELAQRDTLQPNDSLPFETREDSQLDHLVPLQERKEQKDVQQGVNVNEVRVESHEEQLQSLLNFKLAADAAVANATSSRVWEPGAVSQLQGALHSKAKSETPSSEDYAMRTDLVNRLNEIVRGGLLQFSGLHVETYGSFTSGLFTPNGDMDIAIEGTLQLNEQAPLITTEFTIDDDLDGTDVSELHKDEKAALLRALSKKLFKGKLCDIKPQGIFHARVPIIKFVDSTSGVPCDMAVGSGGARFKSIMLKQLSMVDSRLPDMIRLVKLWAKAWNMNDASDGTFNTFALCLMVIFHLQTREPPILPPICTLFHQRPDEVTQRPIHAGRRLTRELIEATELRRDRALAWKDSRSSHNNETLLELFSSFFALYSETLSVWISNRESRAVRCCSWAGEWMYKPWQQIYIIPIEDPFDTTDNCARSIFKVNAKPVQEAFAQTAAALSQITAFHGAEQILRALFDPKPKRVSLNPFFGRQGVNWQDGWNRRQGDREQRGPRGRRRAHAGQNGNSNEPGPVDSERLQDGHGLEPQRPKRDDKRLWQPLSSAQRQPRPPAPQSQERSQVPAQMPQGLPTGLLPPGFGQLGHIPLLMQPPPPPAGSHLFPPGQLPITQQSVPRQVPSQSSLGAIDGQIPHGSPDTHLQQWLQHDQSRNLLNGVLRGLHISQGGSVPKPVQPPQTEQLAYPPGFERPFSSPRERLSPLETLLAARNQLNANHSSANTGQAAGNTQKTSYVIGERWSKQ